MAASAYISKRNEIVKAIRQIRKALRTNDTKGESIERRLDSLISRKTMITPEQFGKVVTDIQNFVDMAQKVAAAVQVVMSVMG